MQGRTRIGRSNIVVSVLQSSFLAKNYFPSSVTISVGAPAPLHQTPQKNCPTLLNLQNNSHYRPVGYKYKKVAESKYSRFGFVAQEVESLLPSLTTTDPRGYKYLHLKDLISVLTLGLQSMDTVTAAMEHEIDLLDLRVDADHEEVVPRISAVEEAFLQVGDPIRKQPLRNRSAIVCEE